MSTVCPCRMIGSLGIRSLKKYPLKTKNVEKRMTLLVVLLADRLIGKIQLKLSVVPR